MVGWVLEEELAVALAALAALAAMALVLVQRDTSAGHSYFRNDLDSAHSIHLHGSQHLLHIQEPRSSRFQIQVVSVVLALALVVLALVVLALGRHHTSLAPGL